MRLKCRGKFFGELAPHKDGDNREQIEITELECTVMKRKINLVHIFIKTDF